MEPFKPAGYEVDFMQVNELNVQNMIPDEEHKMRLVGKIDRMDTRGDRRGRVCPYH